MAVLTTISAGPASAFAHEGGSIDGRDSEGRSSTSPMDSSALDPTEEPVALGRRLSARSPQPGLDDGLGEVAGVAERLRLLRYPADPRAHGDRHLEDPEPVAHGFDEELGRPELVLVQL